MNFETEVKLHVEEQANAILKSGEYLNEQDLKLAGNILLNSAGNVILTGIGKSGIIGKKVAATMTSTGTPAFFLHPTEALHGDMGIVSRDDVVIALSNSGESNELLDLIRFVKKRGNKVIAIVGNLSSRLSKMADVSIHSFTEKEVGHLSLAPTSSTTVSLVICDALALALMKHKGITENDFALNHPSGRLGRRLTYLVNDVMCKRDAFQVCKEQDSIIDAINRITESGLGTVAILNSKEELLGIITDGDVRRAMVKYQADDLNSIKCNDIMTKNPIVIDPEVKAYDALLIMEKRDSQISVLPVVNKDNRCIGLVRLHDIISLGI